MGEDGDDLRKSPEYRAAKARGRKMMEEFVAKSDDDKIEIIAQIIYRNVALDPYGYPNGRPEWNELPDIDSDYEVDVDKERYRSAARETFERLMWKPK